MAENETWGIGGLDPTKPNNNRVAVEPGIVDETLTNRATIEQAARNALSANRTYVQQAQAAKTAGVVRDQVDALTRQNNGVIRLLLGLLDGIN